MANDRQLIIMLTFLWLMQFVLLLNVCHTSASVLSELVKNDYSHDLLSWLV